ncbi:MAG: hypothetical protein UY82_C0007G0008 [Candidatus Uhrbacteria bacterium GW2011_GWC2_53_7]|uniref:Phospho-N-acetylmuramoyl-pentapeptide-transferase n=1 Tax=Candidatus Uhrbacteria bacterium GW2011_GWC2_53_7 TaxID=1618986 RepID=A0A0G1Y1A1_9BACT|nr:MAG: hypothetical protein UY82_C0007G0008 [Candidatus Uhrbacteria bacterium GW2011_GWC2_53_7]
MLTNLAVTKLLVVATLAFALAFMFTPVVMRFLFKHKFGKRLRDVKEAPIFHRLHAKKLGLPTMGGLVVWIPVLALALGLHALSIWLVALATNMAFGFLAGLAIHYLIAFSLSEDKLPTLEKECRGGEQILRFSLARQMKKAKKAQAAPAPVPASLPTSEVKKEEKIDLADIDEKLEEIFKE